MAKRGTHPSGGKQLTKQSDALETDINRIINRFVAHLHVPDPNAPQPTYGNFADMPDFHTALNRVKEAENQFMQLPSQIRRHVENDPGKFLDMVHDPTRKEELVELGLLPGHEPAPPAPAAPAAPEEPETPPE